MLAFLKVKNNVFRLVLLVMVGYWLLINIILMIIAIINWHHWLLVSGFNSGFLGSFIGFTGLFFSSKWLTSGQPWKQTIAYFCWFLRMAAYGTIILLIIFFKFANIIAAIVGLSMLMVSIMTAMLFFDKKERKKKES